MSILSCWINYDYDSSRKIIKTKIIKKKELWEKYEIIPIEFFVQNLITLMINLCEQEMIKNH